jgi:hypothetical protein
MNRIVHVFSPLVLGVALSLSLTQPASGAAGSLSGTWTSTDTDGSSQVMTITGSGQRAYAITAVDSVASLCGGAPALIVGAGSVVEDGLVSLATVTCVPGGNLLRFRVAISYEYDAGADTLTDSFGVVWSRAS